MEHLHRRAGHGGLGGRSGALAAAQALFRSPATSPTDRLRAIGAALSAIAAAERKPRPRYVAEYADFAEFARRLDETLAPYPEERAAVMKILDHHDAMAPSDAPAPSAPLDEVVSVIDGMLAGELADRDKASAVHAKVRAARIQARLDDAATSAADYPAMKQAILAVLKKNPQALRAVADAFS